MNKNISRTELISYRRKNKLTQEDIASKIGVSRRTVQYWEAGKREISTNNQEFLWDMMYEQYEQSQIDIACFLKESDITPDKLAQELNITWEQARNFIDGNKIPFDEFQLVSSYVKSEMGFDPNTIDINSHENKKVIEDPEQTYQPNDKSKFKSRKRIPYYDIDASGGDVTMFSDNPETPAGFLEEFFDDCDFAMNLWGHSMFPDYSNGEVIVLKQIFDKDQILFGEAYLIVTDELRTVKYIRKSNKGDDFIMLVPKNEKYYDPIDLHKEKVTQIFLVKGKIVRNA